MPALKPLEPPFPKDIARVLSRYPHRDGYIIGLFRVFANSMRFLTDKGVANLLDRDSPVSIREREIVILRTCANNHCEYEWGVHVTAFSEVAGLTETEITATLDLNSTTCWTGTDWLLIRVIDELCRDGIVHDETYLAFQETWDLAQQLEIFALCGNYHTISFVANSSRIEKESFAATFPDTAWSGHRAVGLHVEQVR